MKNRVLICIDCQNDFITGSLGSKEAEAIVQRTNANLRDGTTKLIYTRAKQMGYAVQEVKKGTQTQLVLVRYE